VNVVRSWHDDEGVIRCLRFFGRTGKPAGNAGSDGLRPESLLRAPLKISRSHLRSFGMLENGDYEYEGE